MMPAARPCAVVLSCPPEPADATAPAALRARLEAAGVPAVIVPHVYHLSPDAPAARMLAEAAANGCDLVVAAHLPPRATRWTLDALGCPAGRVRVLDLRSCADADACVAALREAIGAAEVVPLALGAATAAPALRWYPVIDRDRCTGCGQCQDFCLFGVYATGADGAVRVAHGDACKPGCPACARVCPAGAIMFPHYRDPAIAGAEAADAPAPAAADQARAERDACAAGDDGLDALIDALDRLDDDPLP